MKRHAIIKMKQTVYQITLNKIAMVAKIISAFKVVSAGDIGAQYSVDRNHAGITQATATG